MPRAGIGEIIKVSFDRTILILFKPFDAKKWLKLLFIAYLAGCLGSGGSMGNKIPGSDTKKAEASAEEQVLGLENEVPATSEVEYIVEEEFFYDEEGTEEVVHNLKTELAFLPDWFFNYFALIVFVFLAACILFSWLQARFQFIWFDAVVNNEPKVKDPFKKYEEQGNSLFKFYMVVFFGGLFLLAALGYWVWTALFPFDAHADSAGSFLKMLSLVTLPVIIFVAAIIAGNLLYFFIQHFLVPIMAKESCLFKEGWARFVQIYKDNTSDLWIFLLVSIGLGIAGGLATMLVSLLVMLALAIIALLFFGFLYLLLVALFKIQFLFWVVALVIGIPFIAVSLLILTATNLPLAVFFRNFSLYFLADLDCGITPFLPEE